jgi:hypothetical protein
MDEIMRSSANNASETFCPGDRVCIFAGQLRGLTGVVRLWNPKGKYRLRIEGLEQDVFFVAPSRILEPAEA